MKSDNKVISLRLFPSDAKKTRLIAIEDINMPAIILTGTSFTYFIYLSILHIVTGYNKI